MFTAAKMAAELEQLRDENRALHEEIGKLWVDNTELSMRVAELDKAARQDRHERQLGNLLAYDGRPQADNLGGADDGEG